MKESRVLPQGDGLYKVAAFDFGVDYCGWASCEAVKNQDGINVGEIESGSISTNFNDDKRKENLLNRYRALADIIVDIIGLKDYYIFEIPGSSIYNINKSSTALIVKRANGIRDLQSSIFFSIERIAGHFTDNSFKRNLFYNRFKFCEPSQWQDKKEMKKFLNSKEWSIDKAGRITGRRIKIHHEADAICILDKMIIQKES